MTAFPDLTPDIEASIGSTVTCAAWLARRGEFELAVDMRREFMAEWDCPAEVWNERVDVLIDYAERKGEGVDPAHWFRAVRL